MSVLITAGATRNPIDAIRYLSAHSSGRTGVRMARALQERGIHVHLLGSSEALLRATEIQGEEYRSTRDLMQRMKRWVLENPQGTVVHSAAVGDYEVREHGAGKIPSGQGELTLTLTPTPKIANHVRDWGLRGFYVTFKAAPPETSSDALIQIAQKQRERTGCDLVFANVLGRLKTGIALVGADVQWFDRRDEAQEALHAVVAHQAVD